MSEEGHIYYVPIYCSRAMSIGPVSRDSPGWEVQEHITSRCHMTVGGGGGVVQHVTWKDWVSSTISILKLKLRQGMLKSGQTAVFLTPKAKANREVMEYAVIISVQVFFNSISIVDAWRR